MKIVECLDIREVCSLMAKVVLNFVLGRKFVCGILTFCLNFFIRISDSVTVNNIRYFRFCIVMLIEFVATYGVCIVDYEML